ncbi:MAG: polysaccharide biosynthesis protein, partial [Planctomycetaceae bacterium]
MADIRTLKFLIRHRFGIIVSAYLLMYVVCYFGAYLLRFDFALNNDATIAFQSTLPWVLAAKMLACRITREWWRRLRYTTVTDIMSIGWGSAGVAAVMFTANPFVPASMQIPRSVIGIDFLLAVLSTCLLRTAYRVYVEAIQPRLDGRKKLRTVIYGRGDAAISMLKSIQGMLPDYQVVGVIDEHLDKDNSFRAAGIPVFSAASGLTGITSQVKATHVLISGSVPGKKVRQLLGLCQDIGLKAHVIPDIDEIVSGRLRVSIRDVTISDLLRREPVRLDIQSIQAYVTGARVLVTGAAGSIGSELCRQILKMNPTSLVMLDQSECGIFHLQQELESSDTGQTTTEYAIGDCTESQSIRRIMLQYRPEIVFHAAAYKHVPLMESAPQESIRNNV